jgi:hypothetical protein
MAGRRAYSWGRFFERQGECIPVAIVGEVGGSRLHEDGTTINISRGGVRVQTTASLTPGQLVEIMPKASQGHTTRGRVVWVGQSNSLHDVGIEFLKPIPMPPPWPPNAA